MRLQSHSRALWGQSGTGNKTNLPKWVPKPRVSSSQTQASKMVWFSTTLWTTSRATWSKNTKATQSSACPTTPRSTASWRRRSMRVRAAAPSCRRPTTSATPTSLPPTGAWTGSGWTTWSARPAKPSANCASTRPCASSAQVAKSTTQSHSHAWVSAPSTWVRTRFTNCVSRWRLSSNQSMITPK